MNAISINNTSNAHIISAIRAKMSEIDTLIGILTADPEESGVRTKGLDMFPMPTAAPANNVVALPTKASDKHEYASLNERERVLLYAQKKKGNVWNVALCAEATSVKRQNVYQYVANMAAEGILVRQTRGHYHIARSAMAK